MIVLPLRLRLQPPHHVWKVTTHLPPSHKPGSMPGASSPLLQTVGGWRLGWHHCSWVAFWCTLPLFGNVYDGSDGGGYTICIPSLAERQWQWQQCQDNGTLPPAREDLCQACLLPPHSLPGLGLCVRDGSCHAWVHWVHHGLCRGPSCALLRRGSLHRSRWWRGKAAKASSRSTRTAMSRPSEVALCPLLPWYCVKLSRNVWFRDF